MRDCKAAASTKAPASVGQPAAEPAQEGTEPRPGRVTQAALLGLDAEHVTLTASGATLRFSLQPNAAEPAGVAPAEAITLARTRTDTCPVWALEDWLAASDTDYGPVFRPVDRWGNVEHGRLGPDGFSRIVARRAGGMHRVGARLRRARRGPPT